MAISLMNFSCTFRMFPHNSRNRVSSSRAVQNYRFPVNSVLIPRLHLEMWWDCAKQTNKQIGKEPRSGGAEVIM